MPPRSREPHEQSESATERHVPPPAQDSPEREHQQRIGEALLNDDGRIQNTPQAKTIAIETLARRMRTPTRELALSAVGLNVGTDMIERLGDHRYVLAPLNEQYPSMGADVLHVDELDPAEPRHAPDKVVRMDRPEADALVRQIAVSEVMSAWAYGSNNNVRALAIQEITQEEFDLPQVLEWDMDAETRKNVNIELGYNRDAFRDFARTQYEMTQEVLAERGITELIGYRALTWREGAPRPEWADQEVGSSFQALHRPLESWSADRQVAADWLETRGGPGVILAERMPAEDILSVPLTGMGYLGQKEWVALSSERPTLMDGVSVGRSQEHAAERTAASSVNVGGPALGGGEDALPEGPTNSPDAQDQGSDPRWQPLEVTGHQLNPTDLFDHQTIRTLDGEQHPGWWPRDDSGYAISKRDLDFLGVDPVQIKWLASKEAPMGMTPELYDQFGTELLEALQRDGVPPDQVDIRLKGTGSGFFSGIHKELPREEDIPGNPEAAERMREWFGDSGERPKRRPHDSMWRLGLESVPSDFDLDINSTRMIRAARKHWKEQHPDRYSGDFMGGHGYLDKGAVKGAFPNLAGWTDKWENKLGREISVGAFESSGPVNATKFGRSLSGHFRSTDWIIHNSDQPWAERSKSQAQTWLSEYWNHSQGLIERGELTAETAPTMLRLHSQADRMATVAYAGQDEQLMGHVRNQTVQKAVFQAGQLGVDNAALPSHPEQFLSATDEEKKRYAASMRPGKTPDTGKPTDTAKTAPRPQRRLSPPGSGKPAHGTPTAPRPQRRLSPPGSGGTKPSPTSNDRQNQGQKKSPDMEK
ncbi:hypothetical protein HNR06_002622 [Nocardiopsis arvandica]|uniref:Uncharacterized protein n=1 Tax=Nocardiopsis sinuspersici TaxID=501010 RepID=A0A7Y9XC78_9ACTN|nr:hypothetical protein [Nocardiopsis sinuspersici]NYH53033.1 hypothetical protein [Nocardiopsis sinuspersici]